MSKIIARQPRVLVLCVALNFYDLVYAQTSRIIDVTLIVVTIPTSSFAGQCWQACINRSG